MGNGLRQVRASRGTKPGVVEVPMGIGLRDHWDDLIARVQATALLRYRDHVPIVVSQLGDDVGLLGAAAYAFEQN